MKKHELKFNLMAKLDDLLPEENGWTISESVAHKNNGITTQTIQIGRDNGPERVFKMDELLARHKNGESIDEMVQSMYDAVMEDIPSEVDDFVNNVHDFDKMKNRITLFMMNVECNQEYLKSAPHRLFGDDIAITYQLIVSMDEDGSRTAKVNNLMMEQWNITEEELYDIALKNTTKLFPTIIQSAQELLPFLDGEKVMYVVTNLYHFRGAVNILDIDELQQLAEETGYDLWYIIPSSIHECLMVPEPVVSLEWLNMLIQGINSDGYCVRAEEVLGDHALIYNRALNTIEPV